MTSQHVADATLAIRGASTSPPSPRAWRPSAFIQASIGLHAAGAVAAGIVPALWPWALGAIVANQAILSGAGMFPRSRLLGPNLVRLPAPAVARREIALTFDDGPDPDNTPRVLDLLDRHGARGTFFVVGQAARAHGALVREIIHRGHGVENHTDRHSMHFPWYGPRRLAGEIGDAQRAIEDACGVSPVFFRAPMGLRTPLLEPVLSRLGLHLASWSRRAYDTRETDPLRVAARLTRGLAAGDILLLHDGVALLRKRAPDTVGALGLVLAAIRTAGLRPVTLRTACADARIP